MPFTTLISAEQTRARCSATQAPLVLLDCGFDLADTAAGERAWATGHLPGRALRPPRPRPVAAPRPAATAAIPCPHARTLAATVGRWGIAPGVQVVVYDRQGGALCGARLVAAALAGARRGGRARRRRGGLAGGRRRRWTTDRADSGHRKPPYPARPTRPCRRSTADELLRAAGPRAPARRPRRRALSRRGRAAGPGGRPHSRRDAALLQGQPRRRRPLQAGRATARGVRGAGRRRRQRSCTNAARASPPATTCSRWPRRVRWRPCSTPAPGASGAPTRRGRSRAA